MANHSQNGQIMSSAAQADVNTGVFGTNPGPVEPAVRYTEKQIMSTDSRLRASFASEKVRPQKKCDQNGTSTTKFADAQSLSPSSLDDPLPPLTLEGLNTRLHFGCANAKHRCAQYSNVWCGGMWKVLEKGTCPLTHFLSLPAAQQRPMCLCIHIRNTHKLTCG